MSFPHSFAAVHEYLVALANADISRVHGLVLLDIDTTSHGRRPTPKSGGDQIGKLLVRKT